jgi:uncharacterized protein YecE (DUF72 family)
VSVLVGTSGWQYDDWRDVFYPHAAPRRAWLAFYAAKFATVEVNNTFYRLPEADTFRRWASETPDGFVVAVKVSRYLSHIKRLVEPEEPIARFVERASALGPRLGPALLQLPPDFTRDDNRLRRVLERWPANLRLAVEFRHRSWFDNDVFALLAAHGVALCLTDRHGPREPLVATAPWGYVRLHQGTASPEPCYGRTALRSWAERIRSCWDPGADVYVYFNNDHRACAVRNAMTFRRLVDAQPASARTASPSSASHIVNKVS